ncbi:helix-turn-helix domain-containing protein [Methylobacterium sp. WL12]|uniref:helix-turn-helix domain-containing protein n=1 Tax=Methylobacterium sp. WL12 TaxID=2603890 RepID=UPI0011C77D00|nr:helix-turn-helix domain-containing protein [Methylobacterium sp. WL12]TXM65388.1 helix-turn-helix domain-containing protein [Methylobacterium sp. WL12]
MQELRDLGEQIATNRKARRMPVRRLAMVAGVSPAWLAALEKGEIADPSIAKVARVLNGLDLDLRVREWHGGVPDLDELSEENERLRQQLRDPAALALRFR